MTSRAIVAFGEHGTFFSCRPSGHTFYTSGLPKGLLGVLDGAVGHTYFWVSLGPAGQFYVGWKRKDGTEFFKLGDKTGDYAGLWTYLDEVESIAKVKVVFGPTKGSWFLITGRGGYRYHKLGEFKGLSQNIDKHDAQGSSGVRHVGLGKDGAWVVAYRNGSADCDLKGDYGMLQRVVHDLSKGELRGVFVNPFSSSDYVIGYKNGAKKSHLPHNWHEKVSF